MPFSLRNAAIALIAITAAACAGDALVAPVDSGTQRLPSLVSDDVFFSEIHYDNGGTDVGEALEISAPEGRDLTGWSVVLYNGSNSTSYRTDALTRAAHYRSTCNGRDYYVVTYNNLLQNGAPDGMALLDGTTVVEFRSYEGVFTATIAGTSVTSTDIGVSQNGSGPTGVSLQRRDDGSWATEAAETFGTCNNGGVVEPPPPPPPSSSADARINEFHYDNVSTDVGEGVEIEGAAGLSLDGWKLVLYNGNNGADYFTHTFTASDAFPATCGTRGVIFIPAVLQNGDPDAIALVDGAGALVQFVSYGGSFMATTGPALNAVSVDVGVKESSSTPAGYSIARDAAGVWQAPAPATFGQCNDAAPPPPSGVPLIINELMGDPENAESASWGEWFEVYNYGTAPIDLQGWTIRSGGSGQVDHTIASSVIVPAGGYAVLGRGADPARNGGITLAYNYFTGSSTIFLDDSDWLSLHDATGARVDSVRWTNTAHGVTRGVRNALIENTEVDGANWGYATTTFGAGDYGTPGAANGTLSNTPPAVFTISFTTRGSNEPPLPVGFMDQFFARELDPTGATVPTTITWTSETPGIVSVDARGNVLGLAAGTGIVRATATDGTTRTASFQVATPVASPTAQYDNTEFGIPTDGDASDDFIITHGAFTASYSSVRNTPNWVSYNLEVSHLGDADRCNCFTPDPLLPPSFARLLTTDYSGAGDFAGYPIDRGHLAPSADRSAGSLDNASTFYFTNIIPQAAAVNQGPWADLESALRDSASSGAREVYIVTGVAGSKGTVKGEGVIVIPQSVWKVAVIMPRNQGVADVDDWRDVRIIAVNMPNEPTVTRPWQQYLTTVDAIEAASGYDVLSLLPDFIERIVESGTRPPVARITGTLSGDEGSALQLSAATSTDPDNDALTFAWSFGDGASATGSSATHTYAQDGSYAIRLIATDVYGLADTANAVVSIGNVGPVIAAINGATLLPGETFNATGTFTDPGADVWTAIASYGDGTPEVALNVNNHSFTLSHIYATPGSFNLSVRVSDGTAEDVETVMVRVLTHDEAAQGLVEQVNALDEAGRIEHGNANALNASLAAAAQQIEKGGNGAAANQLRAAISKLDAFEKAGRIPSADAAVLRSGIERLMASLAL
ncbi:MAG TPA: DNA/RNA non-specific endonuclease [Longimicrobiales bacterium]